jgi:acyl dehydratase
VTVDPNALAAGDEIPGLRTRVTRETLVRYAGASGDFNPIHYSEFHAERLGLPGVIGHGMLTMGTALRAVTDWIGDPGRVRSAFVRFSRPVPVPDDDKGAELTVAGKITKIESGCATVQLDVRCGEQKVLGVATAEVDLEGAT